MNKVTAVTPPTEQAQPPATLPSLALARTLVDHSIVSELKTSPFPCFAESDAPCPVVLTREVLYRVEIGDNGAEFKEHALANAGLNGSKCGRGVVVRREDLSERLLLVTACIPGEVTEVGLDERRDLRKGYFAHISSMHRFSPRGNCLAGISMHSGNLDIWSIEEADRVFHIRAGFTYTLGGTPTTFRISNDSSCVAAGLYKQTDAGPKHSLFLGDLDSSQKGFQTFDYSITTLAFHPSVKGLFIGDESGRYFYGSCIDACFTTSITGRLGEAPISASAMTRSGAYFGTADGKVWALDFAPPDSPRHSVRQIADFPGQKIFDIQPVLDGNYVALTFAEGGALLLKRSADSELARVGDGPLLRMNRKNQRRVALD